MRVCVCVCVCVSFRMQQGHSIKKVNMAKEICNMKYFLQNKYLKELNLYKAFTVLEESQQELSCRQLETDHFFHCKFSVFPLQGMFFRLKVVTKPFLFHLFTFLV